MFSTFRPMLHDSQQLYDKVALCITQGSTYYFFTRSYTQRLVTLGLSKRPNAGKGVFATTDIHRNTKITSFSGQTPSSGKMNPDYVMNFPQGVKVYGKENPNPNDEGCAQIINDFTPLTHEDCVDLPKAIQKYIENISYINTIFLFENSIASAVSLQDIKKGEELYVSYGLKWWLSRLGCDLYLRKGGKDAGRFVESLCEYYWSAQQKRFTELHGNMAPSFGKFEPFLPAQLSISEGIVTDVRTGLRATPEQCKLWIRTESTTYDQFLERGMDPYKLAHDLIKIEESKSSEVKKTEENNK